MAHPSEATTSPPAGEAKSLTSLRVRLALALAVSVGITGVGASWLALQLTRRALVIDVTDIAGRAAQRAAIELQRLPSPLSQASVNATLRQLEASIPEIETLSYIQQGEYGLIALSATTVAPAQAALALAQRSISDSRLITEDTGDTIRVAAPVVRKGEQPGAVIVRADLAAVIGLQQRALRAVIGFALLAVVGLVVLVDLLAWPLIHRPIQQLRETIARVTAGDFSARAPVARHDELGEVADGLNEMLARMESLNDSLQTRVREATMELRERNQQLTESYHRLFGVREQLASAEQMASVGQTAANVAHQVGTPLNLISGYVQLLKEELGPESHHGLRLAIIEEQIAKVTSTVRTLLDRSRQMARKTRTPAGVLVGRVCEVIRPNLDAASIKLDLHMPAGETPILVDATSLELALLNLMTNAVDAMPSGGTLRVRVTSVSPSRVGVEISDTGHGIPADLLPRIFEPWVSTKKPGRGTGLGLPIARDVVSAHGGTIAVTSTVGGGTKFRIELPSDIGRDAVRTVS